MAKTWVLSTETKGTGAEMVPLDRVTKRSAPEPLSVPRKPKRREPEPPKPRPPRRFRVVDVRTRQTLVEDASAVETVTALRDVHHGKQKGHSAAIAANRCARHSARRARRRVVGEALI